MQYARAIQFSRHSLGPTLCWPLDRSPTLVLPLAGWACSQAPGEHKVPGAQALERGFG